MQEKTIIIYNYKDNFQVEIIEENGFVEFWLYNTNYGIKMFMFGIECKFCQREKYIEIIENIIEENIEIYKNEYMEDHFNAIQSW